jgi:hypothetical protein
MAIIPQPKVFSGADLPPVGDWERLQVGRDTIPDESWMRL